MTVFSEEKKCWKILNVMKRSDSVILLFSFSKFKNNSNIMKIKKRTIISIVSYVMRTNFSS